MHTMDAHASSTSQPARVVRLLLGDQLNAAHTWWQSPDPDVLTVLMECRQETDYARHHVQKVLAFFLAMRSFAKERIAEGYRVHYLPIDDPDAARPMLDVLRDIVTVCGASEVRFQLPDEWRLDQLFQEATTSWPTELGVIVHVDDTEHFLTSRTDLADHFRGKKQYLMESFYREMRKQYDVLMDAAGQPEGGTWNYDANNRKKLPKGHVPPAPRLWERDVCALLESIRSAGVETVGRVDATRFGWPVTRTEKPRAPGSVRRGASSAVWGFPRCPDGRQLDCLPQPPQLRDERQDPQPARGH